MIIQNEMNLPEAIVNAVTGGRKPTPDRIGVNEFNDAPQIRYLRMKHWDEIIVKPEDNMFMLQGLAPHYILQLYAPDHVLTEEKLTIDLGGITLVGVPDYYDNGLIADFKFTSVWAFKLAPTGVKPEWEAQLNLYAHLFKEHHFPVTSLKIWAFLRDWTQSKVISEADYPKKAVMSVDVPLWSENALQEHLRAKLADHTAPIPRPCTDTERWMKKDSYRVVKTGRKTALRVLETEKEAIDYIANQKEQKGLSIQLRKGEPNRCLNYCIVNSMCPQHKDYLTSVTIE